MFGQKIKSAIAAAWDWLLNFFQFFDDPTGKFSHKRGIAILFAVVSVIMAFHGAWISSIVFVVGTVVIVIATASSKT